MTLYGVVGVGGFGREVMPVANLMLRSIAVEPWELVFVDKCAMNPVNGYRVLSEKEFEAYDGLKKFCIAVADGKARRRVAQSMVAIGATPFSVIASNSVQLDSNTVGEGVILAPFTTITSNVEIGAHFHCNIYSYVAHDCVIGDYVTFAPNVQCNGNVIIEDGAYIGTGAVIRQGSQKTPLIIGRDAVVGMGAIVTKNVEAGTTVFGNPAMPRIKPTITS